MNKRMHALGRLKTGAMNGTEMQYANLLETKKQLGLILWYKFEGVKLRLADNTFYTPDFFVMDSNYQLQCHEVKGFWTDDARVKIKVAADMYPFKFVAVMKNKKNSGGGFAVEEF